MVLICMIWNSCKILDSDFSNICKKIRGGGKYFLKSILNGTEDQYLKSQSTKKSHNKTFKFQAI